MQYLKVFFIVCLMLMFAGCAMDTLQEDTLTFDLTDDIWNGFEYLHHMTDFDRLPDTWPLLLSEKFTQC